MKLTQKPTSKRLAMPLALIGSLLIAGCASDGSMSKTQIGAITGAIGGAILGKQVGGKDRQSTAIGAVLGGLAGAGVGHYMDKQQRELEDKLAQERASKQIAIERLQNNIIRVNLDSAATFKSGKADLNPSFDQSLTKLAQSLGSNNQTVVHVIGYTDNVGSDDFNLRLSEQRAQSVQQFLIAKGVASDRTRTQGLGKNHPTADNSTESGRRQNRRVEIYLKPIIQGQEDQAFVSPIN